MEVGHVHLHSVGLFDVVGNNVGSSDGLLVGLVDGLLVVGFKVGRLVGLIVVGLGVGIPVGTFVVGLAVGTPVGAFDVGTLVGADVVTVASEQSVARYHTDPLLGVIIFALFTIASRT